MSIINVSGKLEYEVTAATTFLFSIVPALTPHQRILHETLILSPNVNYEWLKLGDDGIRHIRMEVQKGNFLLDYKARVELNHEIDQASQLAEVEYQALPAEVMAYLNPSRYCESDRLSLFAKKEFGDQLTGHNLVEAVCDWVYRRIDYIAGSTDSSSSACDVLVNRAGVCRDFAHLCIALCRTLGIPARYISGYAVNLQPPDFHGFFEAFLGGKWYLYDATNMAPLSGLVRIGVGRDAADTSFATVVGAASLTNMEVMAVDSDENLSDANVNQAISTA